MQCTVHLTLIVSACVLLSSCDKSANIGGGYTITRAVGYDGHGAGPNHLYYNGIKVCDMVGMYQYHDGILIFMGNASGSANEQLFAVRGAGPRVLLSERIVKDQHDSHDPISGAVEKEYRVEDITRTADGVQVRFFIGVNDKTGEQIVESDDLSWPQIQTLIQEAETSAPVQAGDLGNYRRLPRKSASPSSAPAGG